MITEKNLIEYGLENDEGYFQMIVESALNGQRKQAIKQFQALGRDQRKSCLRHWLDQVYEVNNTNNAYFGALRICIEAIY